MRWRCRCLKRRPPRERRRSGDGARTGSPGERAEEHAGASGGRPLQDDTGGRAEGRAAAGDAPAGGSRLLRALSEPRAPAGAPADDAAPAFAAEGCPRAVLRRLLAGAVDEAGALSALAIERELLALCRERQEIVTGLFETEARLRALRAPAAAPPSPARADTAAAVAAAASVAPVPARAAAAPASSPPSPLRAALAGAEEAPVEAGDGDAALRLVLDHRHRRGAARGRHRRERRVVRARGRCAAGRRHRRRDRRAPSGGPAERDRRKRR